MPLKRRAKRGPFLRKLNGLFLFAERRERSRQPACCSSCFAERILLLDGAMGTMIQRARLAEEDYRGARFRDWQRELRGNNDLLSLTQPRLIRDIHAQYLAGRRRHHRDQHLQLDLGRARRLRHAGAGARAEPRRGEPGEGRGARVRRRASGHAALRRRRARADQQDRVASRPTSTTRAIRAVSFDELVARLREALEGLLEGGVDLLLVETVFDTLNAKAALFAIEQTFAARGAAPAGDHLRHDHRRLGPHALGPDHRGVLQLGAARAAARRRA